MESNTFNFESLILEKNSELSKSNLKKYFLTNLKLKAITYENKFIVYTTLDESKQYQVLVFDTKDNEVLISSISKFYKNKDSKSIDLFLYSNNILIFKNQKFYFLHKVSFELNSNDLKEYFYKKLNLKIDNIYTLKEEDLSKLKQEFLLDKKEVLQTICLVESKNFLFYCIYLCILTLFSFIYFKVKEQNSIKQNQILFTKKQKEYKEYLIKHKFKEIGIQIDYLLKDLSTYKIKVSSLTYSKNQLKLNITSKESKAIYSFLQKRKKQVLENVIYFDKKKNFYRCDLNVRIFK